MGVPLEIPRSFREADMDANRRSGTWTLRIRAIALAASCAAVLILLQLPAAAEMQGDDGTDRGRPPQVRVGMYLSDVPSVDLREGTFAFDAYLWLVWDASRFQSTGAADPGSSLPRSPADSYEVMGVHELDTTLVTSRPGYAAFRLQGKVRQQFDLERFPLDEHVLTIRIQDSESEIHKVLLVPDEQGSSARAIEIHGWKAGAFAPVSATETFSTNFGDPEIPVGSTTVYSSIDFQLPLMHDGWPYFFKLTAALFIATLVAMLAFLIRPTDLDPRFGLPIGALFAAVASNWMVSEALPDRSGLTLADWLHIASYVAIFLTLLLSVRSLALFEAGDEQGSKRFDRRCAAVMPLTYAVASVALVLLYQT
jgi:hypothetical protein